MLALKSLPPDMHKMSSFSTCVARPVNTPGVYHSVCLQVRQDMERRLSEAEAAHRSAQDAAARHAAARLEDARKRAAEEMSEAERKLRKEMEELKDRWAGAWGRAAKGGVLEHLLAHNLVMLNVLVACTAQMLMLVLSAWIGLSLVSLSRLPNAHRLQREGESALEAARQAAARDADEFSQQIAQLKAQISDLQQVGSCAWGQRVGVSGIHQPNASSNLQFPTVSGSACLLCSSRLR